MPRPRVLLAMDPTVVPQLFDDATWATLTDVAEVLPNVTDFSAALPALAQADMLLTGWGCPPIDSAVLARAPSLRAIVHSAGTVRWHVTAACWDANLSVSCAAQANALPVAEYTVAAILFSNKNILRVRDEYRRVRGRHHDWRQAFPSVGNYGRTVGIVGASRIGRRVLELLQPFDFRLLVCDPTLTAAASLGAQLVSLDELCAASDVVSLHAPELPATAGMIGRRHLSLMRDGATLINTARGSLVDHDALSAELISGRLSAVLDTTEPETLPADSPLYDLPNVLLTPHFAGSFGNEVYRMGASAVAEIVRYAKGHPFAHPVNRADLAHTA